MSLEEKRKNILIGLHLHDISGGSPPELASRYHMRPFKFLSLHPHISIFYSSAAGNHQAAEDLMGIYGSVFPVRSSLVRRNVRVCVSINLLNYLSAAVVTSQAMLIYSGCLFKLKAPSKE